jgi:hypothetical protein
VPRIRSIKPEFFRDPKVARVGRDARLLFIGLLTEADDEGRLLASSKLLAGSLYPHDDDVSPGRVTRWLEELEDVDLIRFYESDDDGVRYAYVPTFSRHQRVAHPTPSRIPPPPFRSDSGEAQEVLAPELEQGTGSKEQGREHELRPTPRPRERDPLFDALSESCGMNPFELTEREAKATGVALAQLRHVGATVEEIHRRAANYGTHFESAALTPNALATHWAKCAQPAQPTSPRPRPDPVMQRAQRAAELRRQEEADDAREPDRGAHHALGS